VQWNGFSISLDVPSSQDMLGLHLGASGRHMVVPMPCLDRCVLDAPASVIEAQYLMTAPSYALQVRSTLAHAAAKAGAGLLDLELDLPTLMVSRG
jgi:hypothetical protein